MNYHHQASSLDTNSPPPSSQPHPIMITKAKNKTKPNTTTKSTTTTRSTTLKTTTQQPHTHTQPQKQKEQEEEKQAQRKTTTTTTTTTTTQTQTQTRTQSQTKEQTPPQDPRSLILSSPPDLLSKFQTQVLLLLCQVPRGSFTTYNLLSTHLSTKLNVPSSPRAVGNALRNNPFAPIVPCHRVVATGNTLGGFKGKISRRDGGACLTLQEKRTLLRREGVRFEDGGKGRVLGTPFSAFVL